MDEQACRDLIASSAKLHSELGGTKGPAKEEQVTMDFAFATVVTIAPIKAGEALTKQNLWVKRPGTGSIPAEQYESLLGKKATRDLAKLLLPLTTLKRRPEPAAPPRRVGIDVGDVINRALTAAGLMK